MLFQIKYFDDPALSALRQLDDIMQVFDPEQKNVFLSQTLSDNLPIIPEVRSFHVLKLLLEKIPKWLNFE